MKSFKIVTSEGHEIDYQVINKEIIDAGLIDRQIVHYGNYDPFIKYTIEFKDNFPAMGYQAYLIQEAVEPKEILLDKVDFLENEYYQIKINSNGTLKIYDLVNDHTYDSVLLIEDGSDEGDGYDYSPLLEDYIITSKDAKADYQINRSRYSTTAHIIVEMKVPKDLTSRKQKKCDTSLKIEFQIELKQGERNLDITTNIDNTAKDHRLRVLLPTDIWAQASVSDNQFGIIERPVKDMAIESWQEDNWSERPDSIYPMLSYVAIKGCPLALLTNSVREYEVIGDNYNTLAITYFDQLAI